MNKEQLSHYFEAIAALENEKKTINDHLKETYAQAKEDGFDPSLMRETLKRAKMTREQRLHYDTLISSYEKALNPSIIVE
ncbi:MAG TPA: GapR family DNA-binding domain-containing protein [Candidatus Babeliaceae bacterium]|nr:GapR family DNA-binding domain-containing protein [Candidatus Babeliaceae bacterium]